MKNRIAWGTVAALALAGLVAGCGGDSSTGGGGGGAVNHDGNWTVTVSITSCYSFTSSGTVTVSGGSFSGTLFTYCANPQSGSTYLPTSGCGTDITQTVSVGQGSMGTNTVEGNLYLAGGACNGGNGFYGTLSSATTGSASSYWGTLTFTKQ